MNPCPCGYYGDSIKPCTCSNNTVTRYQKRISGPMLDRIDIHIEVPRVESQLAGFNHIGVGCASREAVDQLCAQAREDGCLALGPTDSGYPVGYWAFLRDPDGHQLEISFGQDVGVTVQAASDGATRAEGEQGS